MFGGQGIASGQAEATPALTDFNMLPAQTSQSAQDILVPYFAGINRIKTMWVSPVLNVNTQEVKTSGGGGKGTQSASSGQFKYFADLVAIIAMGPADNLWQVIIDNTLAFDGLIVNPGTEYTEVSLGQWGSMRLSWGNPNQNAPSAFNLGGYQYGGQRGKIRAEFRQLYFGSVGRTSIPSIEFIIERYPDVPGFSHAHPVTAFSRSGVNPIAVIYEILTNVRYGLGLDPAFFDIPFINASMQSLAGMGLYISPLYDTQQPVRSVIQDLCQYFDGFVRKVNGLIQIGFYTHSSLNGSGAPSLNYDSFLPPGVKFTAVGYTGTVNEVIMTHVNNATFYQPNSIRASDAAARLITTIPRNVSIQRPFLTDPSIAKAYVEEYLRFNANPLVTGSGDVKKESMYTIYPGDLALIQAGDYGAQVLCRITRKSWGEDINGKCSIEFEQERGSFDSKYSAPKEYPDLNFYINPSQIKAAMIIQLPSAINNGTTVQVAVLAERATTTDMGFVTWISDDNSIFDSTHQATTFAIHGVMQSSLASNIPQLTFDGVGFVVKLTGIDTARVQAQNSQAMYNYSTLVFIDKEIMSLQNVTALGNGNFRITVLRGIYGSDSVGHDPGSQVWFIERNLLVPISWLPFTLGDTFYFKIQVYTHFSVFDLSSSSTIAFTISSINASLLGPTNLVVGTDGTYVIFNWVLDPSPQVFGYEIRYGIVGSNWQQASHAIEGIRSAHSVTMHIPPGEWVFYVTSYDQFFNHSANIASYTFTVPLLFVLVEENYGNPQHFIDTGGQIDQGYGNGTFVNCFVHPTAYVLVPVSGSLASDGTPEDNFFDIFDEFVIDPPALCSFTSPVLDSLGSGTNIRSSIVVNEYLWGFSGIPVAGQDLLRALSLQWDGVTIVNGVVHPISDVVVPKSSRLASYVPSLGDGFETFDNFVLDPLTPTTVTYVEDAGEVAPMAVTLSSSFNNGPGLDNPNSSATISHSSNNVTFIQDLSGVGSISETLISRYIQYQTSLNDLVDVGTIATMQSDTLVGPPNYWTIIDGQMRSSPDGTTFGPWQLVSSNFISDRYVQFMASWNPYGGPWPTGISSIWMLLDAPSSVQNKSFVSISAGGTTVTFDPPFRLQLPPVIATIVGSSALFPIVTAQSLTAFTVKVFNQSGSDVGGIINWSAEGV